MTLNEVKVFVTKTIKQAFTNKNILDKFTENENGKLLYNGFEAFEGQLKRINEVSGIDDTPVGHIISHMGNTAPKHYLICDGSEYNIADYPYLVQHIIDNFGSVNYFGGDGAATFAVPDLRGEFLRGTSTATRDTGSGGNVGEHQDATEHLATRLPNNTNEFYMPCSDIAYATKIDKAIQNSNTTDFFVTKMTKSTGWNMQDAYTSRPTNTAVLYCIKYEPTYYMKMQNTNYIQQNIYTQEEKVVGCWINGKPLYRKTLTTKVPKVSTQIALALNDLNIENIIQFVSSFSNEEIINIAPNTSGDNQLSFWYNKTAKLLHISCTEETWTGWNLYITIQYTKQDDDENSFNDSMLDYVENITYYSNEDVTNVVNALW